MSWVRFPHQVQYLCDEHFFALSQDIYDDDTFTKKYIWVPFNCLVPKVQALLSLGHKYIKYNIIKYLQINILPQVETNNW